MTASPQKLLSDPEGLRKAILAERCRRSFARFIAEAWHVLEPTTPLEWNWHIDAMALHLQLAFEGWEKKQKDVEAKQLLQNLLINVPPGTAKSRIVSVMWPAWVWAKHPEWRAIFLSSNPRVALRDSVYCREVIESDWYRDLFAPEWDLADDQNAKSKYNNTRGGYRQAMGFSSRITGDRADAIVWDDPHDAEEVHSDAMRTEVISKWDGAIGNRLNDLRCGLRIGIMQRLHEEDLSGHVLGQGWHHLNIQMEREEDNGCPCPDCRRGESVIGWKDPRPVGGLLFPSRYTPSVLETEKIRLGSTGYAGQMQQRPTPAGGGMIKRHWFRFWRPGTKIELSPVRSRLADGSWHEHIVVVRPPDMEMDEQIQSWDMAFKDTSQADFVAGQVWARKGADKFLLDRVCERLDFTATCASVEKMTANHPRTKAKLVEDKANGPAVIAALRNKVTGLIAVNPEGGKIARTNAASPEIEAGNVYLPHPAIAPWVEDFLNQCTSFPNAPHDDEVDAMTQALARWGGVRQVRFRPL